MMVLVDTSVWSLALRRKEVTEVSEVSELRELIKEVRAQITGPVRQELLSGIRSQVQFNELRDRLQAFPDLELNTHDYELAAEFYNICRSKGVLGSPTDLLLCAIAVNREMPLLTVDRDFIMFQTLLPITLHQPRQCIKLP